MGDGDGGSVDARVERSVRRLLVRFAVTFALVTALAGWAYLGFYQLEPGQAAIVLRLGEYQRTADQAGLRWRLPPPFETVDIINVSEIKRLEFGIASGDDEEAQRQAKLESTMQTGDNSIVNLDFVAQYRVSDAFESRYRVAQLTSTIRDAAQAAVREVVGRMTVDGVLTEQRGELELESKRILQEILDSYDMGIDVMEIELQQVQPPEDVREAFDDVIASAQDASLAINQAHGYQNELLPRARAEALELIESANGYRDAKVAESAGEAQRFSALVTEYQAAPEVTKKRLYLETMEEVLPSVEKIIIEPGTATVLPYLPMRGGVRGTP
jgi:membrane protease subunit HflK